MKNKDILPLSNPLDQKWTGKNAMEHSKKFTSSLKLDRKRGKITKTRRARHCGKTFQSSLIRFIGFSDSISKLPTFEIKTCLKFTAYVSCHKLLIKPSDTALLSYTPISNNVASVMHDA